MTVQFKRAVRRPLAEFVRDETTGGIVLAFATLAALMWANVAPGVYDDVWSTTLGPSSPLHLRLDLHAWVNDGLMTFFFFVVGLEIKRELVVGELTRPRDAAMPLIAAFGGMLVPALIYFAFNAGGSGKDGWGIPLATDIAFVLGALSLLGARAPRVCACFFWRSPSSTTSVRSSSSLSSTPRASISPRLPARSP
jgi:Na+:H+ antiporter, NhaA family